MISLAINFLFTAAAIWVLCFALGLLGVTITFSWKVAFAIWLIIQVIRFFFPKRG